MLIRSLGSVIAFKTYVSWCRVCLHSNLAFLLWSSIWLAVNDIFHISVHLLKSYRDLTTAIRISLTLIPTISMSKRAFRNKR